MIRRAILLLALLSTLACNNPLPCPECPEFPTPVPIEPTPRPNRLVLEPSSFGGLPGWSIDKVAEALPALAATCNPLLHRDPEAPFDPVGPAIGGTVGDWLEICRELDQIEPDDAQAFFERSFRVWRATNNEDPVGLVTGYYEPTLRGSLEPSEEFWVPLYKRPPELVNIDLGAFREDLTGQRTAGFLEGRRLVPYPDRAAIETGALAERGLELVWVDDVVDAFFLHVQGSGRVELGDDTVMRVGYHAANGRPYVSIGKVLIERGEVSREEMSMQAIRAWCVANPEESLALLDANPSYVFFHELKGPGPLGTLGVALVPERAAAIDRSMLPLGAPIYLDTSLAATESTDGVERAYRRLLIAQDTGGSIRGPLRVDIFFGPGERAADIAGHMKQEGRVWLLLPKHLDPMRIDA